MKTIDIRLDKDFRIPSDVQVEGNDYAIIRLTSDTMSGLGLRELRKALAEAITGIEAEGVTPRDCTAEELALLTAPEELELIQHIASYTDEIIGAAKDYDPVRITRYVIELATKFHKFYNACRVKGEEESLMQARLTLCRATATVIRNVLTMFNITVPTSM